MSLIGRLVELRRGPLRRISKELLALYGVEIPPEVTIGRGLRIMHRGFGIVMHQHTRIGDNVTIYHGVTIGRGDPWTPSRESKMLGVHIDDNAIICAGATILCTEGTVTIGAGAVVGASSVVTRDVPPGEIWAGAPARKVGERAIRS